MIQAKELSKSFVVKRRSVTAVRFLRKMFEVDREHVTKLVALDNINIEVGAGDRIGLVGDNGAGKTTLLKIIAGLYRPDSGSVVVQERVSLISGLGIGMLDELTVKENIRLYAALYGIDRRKTRREIEEIIAWAELEEFSDARLSILSSGMRSRLAFSVARLIDRKIQLFDEALTAGDQSFVQKCDAVFEAYKQTDRTFIIASHNLNFVRSFCNKTLWLHKGQQMDFGETDSVLARYQAGRGGNTAGKGAVPAAAPN